MSKLTETILTDMEMPELDLDDVATEPMSQNSKRYDAHNIVETIKTKDFKDIYMVAINDMKDESFIAQQTLCLQIIDQILIKYDYTFPVKREIYNLEDVNNVYKFLEYLEFDCVKLLKRLWKYLNIDLREVDIDKYCDDNSMKIMGELEEQIEMIEEPQMISEFLRTYDKKNFIQFIKEKSKVFRTEILIYNLGG